MVNDIVENIHPRKDILLKNKFSIMNDNIKDQFHISCYIINNKKIQIITRRLDIDSGWSLDLKLKLYDEYNKDFQIISIGSSNENYKIIEMYTTISLFTLQSKDILIPKVIMQTNNKLIKNTKHYNSICTILEKNPDYEYIFFDDKRCREFLIENFKVNLFNNKNDNDLQDIDVIRAFDSIIPGPIRADFFRYCYLYINGGVYIDSKIICNISFNEIIDEKDTIILCSDDAPNSIYNGLIMCTSHNEQIYEVIKECVKNILNNIYLNDIHEPTGNKLFYKYFKNNECKLKKNSELIRFKNNKEVLFISHYKNYYEENYDNFRDKWSSKKYYYKKIINSLNYTFYINPSVLKDDFNIIQLKENIFIIKRIDSNIGWTQNLIIDSFNLSTRTRQSIVIGKSDDNEKVFVIE